MSDCKERKTVSDSPVAAGTIGLPPRQDPGRIALQKAIETLSGQSAAQLQWLGAEGSGVRLQLPVIDEVLLVDTTTGAVCCEDGKEVRPTWQILLLHYLAVRTRPLALPPIPPAVTL